MFREPRWGGNSTHKAPLGGKKKKSTRIKVRDG